MREMKVRVWDDVLKEMLYSRVEQFDDMLGFRFEKHLETENPIYMWSTGLPDRNGREIYEGDVLQRKSPFTGKIHYQQVKWDQENARYLATSKQLQENLAGALERGYEWAGTIYEHPHLLKGEETA